MANTIFAKAQSSFIKDVALSPADQDSFKSTTLQDLQQEIRRIQEKQSQQRSMRYLNRLNPFLTSMEKYGKVVEIFLNVSDVVAFIWGPMKLILITASTHLDALDAVLDAYQVIGEQIPILEGFEKLPLSDHMKEILGWMYFDILDFHKEALRHFRLKVWKQLFAATWGGFTLKIKRLTANMQRHRDLIMEGASMMHFHAAIAERQEAEERHKIALEGAERRHREFVKQFHTAMAERQKAEEELKSVLEDAERRRRDFVIKWLHGFNNDGVQEAHSQQRSICGNAGQWLLKDAQFHEWFDLASCSKPMLWLTGKPGAGKSVLASLVVEELKRLHTMPHVMVAFFYCKYHNDQRNSFLSVARSILAQLIQTPEILLYVYEKASKSNTGDLATQRTAQELLQVALDTRKTHGTTYLVIDGIDECEKGEGSDIAKWFRKYIKNLPDTEQGLVRCLFVSQEDGNSREYFKEIPNFKLTAQSTSNDINAFVSMWHRKLEKKFGELQNDETNITKLITLRADGMFLFAKLMVEFLHGLLSRSDLEHELHPDRFPNGLKKAYDRIKDRMFESRSDRAKRQLKSVMGWIVCAPRPLKWREIQAGVSIDLDKEMMKSNRRLLEHPKSLFSAFIEMNASGVVELVHRTAGQYFLDCKVVNEVETHCSMATLSMAYLNWPQLRVAWANNPITRDLVNTDLLSGTYSFLDYASACWSMHLQKTISAGIDADPEHLAELRETLTTFVGTHWATSYKPLPHISSRLKEDLARLCQDNVSEKIVQSVAWSNKQLSLEKSEAPSPNEALGVWQVVASVRSILESLQPSGLPAEDLQLNELYGEDWFKCPRVSCLYYHQGFGSARLRDRHVDKHDRPFICPEVDCKRDDEQASFATEAARKKHMFEQHHIDILPDMEFPDLREPNDRRGGKKNYDCPHCDKRFTRRYNLNGHVRSVHDGKKPFNCAQCGQAFAWKADCTRHERQHGGDDFVCFGQLDDGTEWGCQKKFSRQDKREEHWRKRGRKCRQALTEQNRRLEGSKE